MEIRVYRARPQQDVYDVVVEDGGQAARYVLLADGVSIPSYRRQGEEPALGEEVGLDELPKAHRLSVESIRVRHEMAPPEGRQAPSAEAGLEL